MWNQPSPEELRRIPALYSTEDVALNDKLIYEHFFIGSSDWYMAEYGPEDRIFFGYARLLPGCGEWGYTILAELERLCVHGIEVDRDRFWVPKRCGKIDENETRRPH